MKKHFEGLNEKQLQAVTAPLVNSLILAGAGSGKTRVLVNRIVWLISQMQMASYAILAVTFTNKAANEMRTRLYTALGSSPQELWVGTFHSLCHRLLRRHYDAAKLPAQFQLLDSDDQLRVIKRVIASLNLSEDQWPPKQAQAFINERKDEGLRAKAVQTLPYGPSKTWLKIYAGYEQVCQISGVVDFAELILRTHEMLANNPDILAHYHQRFQAILVDEFQDTNSIQYAWVKQLVGPSTTVMAVGDDDQSIYGWRGAKVENIHCFLQDFPGAQLIRLEQNYRSTATILNAANALISHNQTRMDKMLWTEGDVGEKILVYSAFNELEEARFISERIALALEQDYATNQIAILYRSNAQSRVIEEALLYAGIAYRIHGGLRFYERAEIKDTLAYLRLIANPHDDTAFERIVNFPARGIGEKTLEAVRLLAQQDNISLWQGANNLLQRGELPPRAAAALGQFFHLIAQLTNREETELDEQLHEVIHQSGLYQHFSKIKGDKSESRLENLQELINAGKQFRYESNSEEELPILVAFLAHASLEAGEMQATEEEPSIHLMTLHAAKGLEFPLVFLVGMEEGLFPSKQSVNDVGRLEEERRLCYVGMTRAMKKLILTYAEVRRQYGREEYHRPSRFLREVPFELLEEVRVSTRFKMPPKNHTLSSVKQNSEETSLRLGERVTHAKFGEGTVLAIEGQGAHTRVQVQFAASDTKWLILAYANLVVCTETSQF